MILIGYSASSYYNSLLLNLGINVSLFERIIFGLCSSIMMIFSIMIHELTHSLLSLKYGINVSEIEFYLFGGVSKITEEPKTPNDEMIIALSGPLMSFLMGIMFITIYYLPISLSNFFSVFTWYFGIMNLSLGLFNLLPGFPMDGGRIVRAFLWKKRNNLISATKTASKFGILLGNFMIGFGFIVELIFLGYSGLWYIVLGSFLKSSAKEASSQTIILDKLKHMKVKNIVNPHQIRIPSSISILDAIRGYFMKYKKKDFLVFEANENNLVGVLHVSKINFLSRDQRIDLHVKDVMESIDQMQKISMEENAKIALDMLSESRNKYLAIVNAKNVIVNFLEIDDFDTALKYSQYDFNEKNNANSVGK